jgi:hypothetical protein
VLVICEPLSKNEDGDRSPTEATEAELNIEKNAKIKKKRLKQIKR